MRLDLHDDALAFARLAPDWDRLARAPGRLGPFSGFGWQFDWWRTLGPGRALRLVVARRGGEVVGVLPLYEEAAGPLRNLALVGSAGGGGDYLDALSTGRDVTMAMLRHALESTGADALVLDDLLETSPTVPAVVALSEGRARVSPRHPCPFLPLDEGLETPRAQTLRRREKWLRALPGFSVQFETGPDTCAPFLARFWRLHAARWERDGGSQAFADGRLVRFHERVVQRYADEGRLRLWTLRAAGEPVAVAWTFDDENRALYYQCGYDPAWGSRSVGHVLLAHVVDDARRRGLSELDFLRGDEAYKREWTQQERRTVRVSWLRTPRATVAVEAERLARTARGLVRRALPDALAVPLTRALRQTRQRRSLKTRAPA